MRMWLIGALLLVVMPVHAQIYKCPGPDGRVAFSDRPCGGAAESPEHEIEVKPQAVTPPSRPQAADDAKWEEQQRFIYVEVPQLEREAAELMASPDPQRQALGKEMAWQAHKAREAFKRLQEARDEEEKTRRRYGDALRQLNGY